MDKKLALTFLIGVSLVAISAGDARAISAELARKCSALTSQAFPPRVPGNPAAGSAAGSGRDVQEYYKKCVANDGRPPVNNEQKSSK